MRKPLICAAVISVACLLAPAGASALSGKPVQIGTSDDSATPAMVVDAAGTAYVAWTIPSTGDQEDPDVIGYCMIPAGKTTCTGGGVLTAGPGNPAIGGLQLTLDGAYVVLVADQFTDSDDEADNYVDEWIAADGTSTFDAVDGGESVARGNGYGGDSLFTLPNAGPAGGPLGYGYSAIGDSGGSYSTDVISPFNTPPTCSEATEDALNNFTCPQTPEATMPAPGDASSQAANYYASESGSDPGVLGVFHSLFASECRGSTAGLSFVYGSGDQSSTDSYGISAGSPGSAWHGNPAIFDCNADNGVPVSGPAGLAVLVDNSAKTDSLDYARFDQSTDSFDAETVVDASEDGTVSDLAAGQAADGGVFSTYYDGNSLYKGPNDLSYSPDGGTIWDGPVALTNLSKPLQESVSSIGSNGQGWLVWTTDNANGTADHYSIYVQQFDQQDVPADATKLFTKQTRGSRHADKLVIAAGDKDEFDTATLSGINARYATGKVDYRLLSGSCTSPSATRNVGTVTLHNAVIGASKKITVALSPGRYFWVAKYSGDRNNAAVTSKCGAAVLTVLSPPRS
jgi:hypothetical protein